MSSYNLYPDKPQSNTYNVLDKDEKILESIMASNVRMALKIANQKGYIDARKYRVVRENKQSKNIMETDVNHVKEKFFIPPTLAGVKMDADTQSEIRAGNAVYKEGFVNSQTGEKFNAFVYYDEQEKRLKFSKENVPFIYRDLENYKEHFKYILNNDLNRVNTTLFDVKSEIAGKKDIPQFTEIQIAALSGKINKHKIDEKFEPDIVQLFQQTVFGEGKEIKSFKDIQTLGEQIKEEKLKKLQESQIFIPHTLAGVKMDADNQKEIRAGNAVYKEGFVNSQTGEKFNAFVYYDEQEKRLKFSHENPFIDRDREMLINIANHGTAAFSDINKNDAFFEKYGFTSLLDFKEYYKLQNEKTELIKKEKYGLANQLDAHIELINSDIKSYAKKELEKFTVSDRQILSDINKYGTNGGDKYYYTFPFRFDYVMDNYKLNDIWQRISQNEIIGKATGKNADEISKVRQELENKLKSDAGEAIKNLDLQHTVKQSNSEINNYKNHFEKVLTEDIKRGNFDNVKAEIRMNDLRVMLPEIQTVVLSDYITAGKIDKKFEKDIVSEFQRSLFGQNNDIKSFNDINLVAIGILTANAQIQSEKEKKIAAQQEVKFKYPSFEDYKAKVSVMQVAESLGYKPDEKSTSLRIQLRDSNGDIILLSRGGLSNQLYRNQKDDLDKGSVIDFVKNRLDRFSAVSGSETERINKILSSFMENGYNYSESINKYNFRENKVFRKEDYPTTEATVPKLHYLTQQRNISPETVENFLPFIQMVGNSKNDFKNIGFPYTIPGQTEVRGYELRNYGSEEKGGFKGFSTGGDKVSAVWLANLAPDKSAVKHVFFAESAIDAMSFYEINKSRYNMNNAAFVSTGGALSMNQINNVMKEFPGAKLHGCFDNDRAGQLYNISLAVAAEKKTLTKVLTDDGVQFKIDDKDFKLKNEDISLANFLKAAGFKSNIQVHVPDAAIGKDWNDILSKKNDINPVKKPKY